MEIDALVGAGAVAPGRREVSTQQELRIATHRIARSPAHPVCAAPDGLLGRGLCRHCCAEAAGRPSVPPSTCLPMLMVGCFEGAELP